MHSSMVSSMPSTCMSSKRMCPPVRDAPENYAIVARCGERCPTPTCVTELPRACASVLRARCLHCAPTRRSLFKGFAMGTMTSAALAASLALFVVLGEQDQFVVDELVSAHLRSLQSGRLIDVQSSDQHTVKPWFNGRLEVAPPVIDLAAEGFILIGGRLDYLDARPVATLVYKRRAHIIDLFVAQGPGTNREAKMGPQLQGFNIWRWGWSGFAFSAVSDINPAELQEFGTKFR